LDYRNLAESVQLFDPGPWTTHQGSATETEPEPPLDQIKSMADIIMNEDSYKNDADLHSLLSGEMIAIWALKTSSNLKSIRE
jgi:hypothetical protein